MRVSNHFASGAPVSDYSACPRVFQVHIAGEKSHPVPVAGRADPVFQCSSHVPKLLMAGTHGAFLSNRCFSRKLLEHWNTQNITEDLDRNTEWNTTLERRPETGTPKLLRRATYWNTVICRFPENIAIGVPFAVGIPPRPPEGG
jgi:hypothetical protein